MQAFLLGDVAAMAVLIVEDNRDIREGIAQLLRMLGYEVATARHGKEGLEQLRRMADKIKLVLLDLMMPVMDGFTFRNRQLANEAIADIPVYVVSGEADLHVRADELGAAGFLTKPFRFPELVDLVRTAYPE